MNIIKRVQNLVAVLLFTLTFLSFQAVGLVQLTFVMAAEGCYTATGSTTATQPLFQSISCPSSLTPEAGKCYFIPTSVQGAGSPTERSCNEIQVGIENGGVPATNNPTVTSSSTPATATKKDVEQACAGLSGVRYSVKINGQEYSCYDKCQLKEDGDNGGCSDLSKNPIVIYLNLIVNIVAGGVGIVIAGMVVFGGVQYSTSRGNPQAVAVAVARIRNAVIALFLYIFGYAILSWLIPGAPF